MTLTSLRPEAKSKYGIGIMGPSYFDGRYRPNLLESGATTQGWVEAASGGGSETTPATNAAGFPLTVPVDRVTRCAIGSESSHFLAAGTYQVDFEGSLAG